MQTIDPPLVAALVAMCVGVLMIQAGLAKRQLAWRRRGTRERSLRVLSRGSVSDDVATHARRSVLIAPPPHAKGAV
jgi:nucleotide-binding universal stress UspA family protein